jgi:hypothetical protein
VVSGGVRERKDVLRWGADRQARAAQRRAVRNQSGFETESEFKRLNKFQTASNFGRLEKYFPGLVKIEIKYGWKALEIRINFPQMNSSRFKMKFELKFREFLRV